MLYIQTYTLTIYLVVMIFFTMTFLHSKFHAMIVLYSEWNILRWLSIFIHNPSENEKTQFFTMSNKSFRIFSQNSTILWKFLFWAYPHNFLHIFHKLSLEILISIEIRNFKCSENVLKFRDNIFFFWWTLIDHID